MNRLLIIGSLLISTLCAQAQQPDAAKLKADAKKVVSSIRGDKAKSQTYCDWTLSMGKSTRLLSRKTRRKLRR